MDDRELERMAALEGSHWWYVGLRDLVRRTLKMPRFAVGRRANVLDAGCGTGENLLLLRDLVKPDYLGGFDISPRAIAMSRQRLADADLYVSDARDPELHVDQVDLLISFDAISISGIDESFRGLARMAGRLRRRGLFILHLPAFKWLRSSHDEAIGTRDRATAGRIRELFTRLGLSVEWITYRICYLFPCVVLARLPSILRFWRQESPISDLNRVPRWLNSLCEAVTRAENRAVCRCGRLPWGSSLYAVARKP